MYVCMKMYVCGNLWVIRDSRLIAIISASIVFNYVCVYIARNNSNVCMYVQYVCIHVCMQALLPAPWLSAAGISKLISKRHTSREVNSADKKLHKIYAYIRTYIHTYIHAHMQYIHSYMPRINIHTHTQTHNHINLIIV